MTCLALVSARKMRNGHGWLGGSKHNENFDLISITEPW